MIGGRVIWLARCFEKFLRKYIFSKESVVKLLKKDDKGEPKTRVRRAKTPEGREDQIISFSMQEAEKRILAGTASDTLLVHFLKLGSTKARLERELLAEQVELTKAKTEATKSAKVQEELYREAMQAFKEYNGAETVDDEYEEDI